MIGDRIGHYQILELIATGGNGTVYRALDARLNRNVAIKVLPDSLLRDVESAKRLEKEAHITASIDHPYICRVFDLIRSESNSFIIMEYVEGPTLEGLLSERRVCLSDAIGIALEVAEALAFAHTHGIIHRDIKPSNIILTPYKHIKVLDFGIAKHMRPSAGMEVTATTRSGTIIGTPYYMSPEQARGDTIDARSDVFSFGVVFYRCLCGDFPFDGNSIFEYMNALMTAAPKSLPGSVPRPFRDIVMKSLQKDTDQRYVDGTELLEDLKKAISQYTTRIPGDLIDARGVGSGRDLRSLIYPLLGGLVLGFILLMTIMRPPRPPLEYILQNRVTWDSSEKNPRISPDESRLSFLSDRSGYGSIWIMDLPKGSPRRLTDGTRGYAWHEWSPDGRFLACIHQEEGLTYLDQVDSDSGQVEDTILIGRSEYSAQVVKWINDTIYVLFNTHLWAVDQNTGALSLVPLLQDLSPEWVDISPVTGDIVLASHQDGRTDLWLKRNQESETKRITNDEARERYVHWSPSGDHLTFASASEDIHGIWRLDPEQPKKSLLHRVDFGSILDFQCGKNEAILVVSINQETSDLWVLDPLDPGPGETRVTFDGLPDIAPTVAMKSGLVVLQRGLPRPSAGYSSFTGHLIEVTSLSDGSRRSERRLTDNGFQPTLSPDEQWLAFLREHEGISTLCEVWISNLGTDTLQMIADDFALAPIYFGTGEPMSRNLIWAPDGSALFYVAKDIGGTMCIRIVPIGSSPGSAHLLFDCRESGVRLGDLSITSDGALLAFTSDSPQRELSSLIVINIRDSGSGTEDQSILYQSTGHLRCVGWQDDEHIVVIDVSTQDIELPISKLVRIDHTGGEAPETLCTTSFSLEPSAVLDNTRKCLYLIEDGQSGQLIYGYSLEDGTRKRVSPEIVTDRVITGMSLLPDGRLLYAKWNRNSDLWIYGLQR